MAEKHFINHYSLFSWKKNRFKYWPSKTKSLVSHGTLRSKEIDWKPHNNWHHNHFKSKENLLKINLFGTINKIKKFKNKLKQIEAVYQGFVHKLRTFLAFVSFLLNFKNFSNPWKTQIMVTCLMDKVLLKIYVCIISQSAVQCKTQP